MHLTTAVNSHLGEDVSADILQTAMANTPRFQHGIQVRIYSRCMSPQMECLK